MASTSKRSQERELAVGFNKVQVTILASEWGSSKGGLSTISRELARQLAKLPEVEITVLLLRCSEEDKKRALLSNVKIVEAERHPGFDELDWLSFPPEHLKIDIIVGHGVKLGHQAQVIKDLKKSKWVQVVHTDPEELGMFKSYSKPISKGQEKHRVEVELCEMADLVVGIGPKLSEAFRSYLRSCHKDQNVIDFTPGVFDEFKSVKQCREERKHCSVLVFGRGDDEDFELKGFDIAARAVSSLPDFRLVFVGAPDGKHEEIAEKLTGCGVPAESLRVRDFVQSREDLKRLFLEVDLALMPSRTEGFGLTGLEALSAGLPVLVSSNSGFGEALSKVPFGSSFVIDPEDPEVWAAAIKKVWDKDREGRLEEAETLRTSYERKYSWANQSRDLLGKMISLLNGNSDINTSLQERFAGASPGEASLQDARTLKPLKLDDQHKVQEGLTEVEAERQNSAVHQISYEIANCESDIAFFAGRHHKDTRQWLFDDFDKWFIDPGDSRAYVLLGDAGVGKSVIAGALARRMKKARRLGAVYFCRHYDGTRNDPRNLLGTIACQLCNCNRQYSKIMGGEDGVRMMIANSNLGVQELCTKLLEEPLSECSPFQRKLVIIDALDETEYNSRKDFICLIKERFPRLPEWLVFFITSRPEDMLQSRLAKYNPCVRICAGNGEQRTLCYQQHEQDIQRFLEESVNFSRLPCSVQDVTRRCNGLFLYAFYIAQELNVSLNSGMIDQFCDLFPGDIEDFFETNLKRVYDKVGADLYGKLLGCIMNAPSPLPVSFVSFVLHKENSSLNEQKVIDAVSQFVVMQERVSFLHSLIPAWLTNKKKAQELYIDEKEAGGYLTEIVKQILCAFLGETRLHLEPIERDLQSFSLHFAVHMLCQHAEKDSLELVFRCLTSYRFLEERISSGRFGIYHLLQDFQRAASCLAIEQREKQNILQEISLAIESDVHVLVESPHLLLSCIRNASDVVQENILIPQESSPWFDLNVYDGPHTVEVLPSCHCFATTSDKQTVVGAKGCLLFLFNASVPRVVSGPFEISGDTIDYIKHLQFSADDKFIFFGRLDKWFSVERETVEDFPQFSGNLLRYKWSVITPNGCYIAVKLNGRYSFGSCANCCLTELVALWARKEIEQSRDEEMTCSFSRLSWWIANRGSYKGHLMPARKAEMLVMGRHTRYLMECLSVDQESYQTNVMFIPKDTSCYCCGKLKELSESNQEVSLATVRQLIIELYSRLFRYQIWNLQSGQPLLHDVFNQDVELNSFAYFCHVANAFGNWGRLAQCSGVDKALSVCNIAVVTTVDRLLNRTVPDLIDDPSVFLHFPVLDKIHERPDWKDWFPLSKFDAALFCASLKSDALEHFPRGFLNLSGKQFSFCLSPKKEWMVKHTSRLGEIQLLQTRIQEENSRNYSSSKKTHRMSNIARFTFTNDDSLLVYSGDTSGKLHALSLQTAATSGELHALSLQTGAVYTSVSGFNLVYFKKEKQVGYLFRCGAQERAVFLKNLFSPFKFLPSYMSVEGGSFFLTNLCSSFKLFGWLPEKNYNLAKCIAASFRSTHTVTCISSDSIVASWNFENDEYVTAFQFKSYFHLSGFPHAHVHQVTPKYVLSPDGKVIALLEQTKITLHSVEFEGFCCSVFEDEFGLTNACLKFSTDSSLLFVCIQGIVKGPHFHVWDVRKQAMSDSFFLPGLLFTVDCFCISSDMSYLILCGGYNEIEVWEFEKYRFRVLERMGVEKFYDSVQFSLCIVSQDNALLVCCIANLIYVYKLTVAKIHSSRQILRGHLGKIEFCRFLKVNRFLISYGVDGMVFLWNFTESKAIGFARIAQGEEKIVSMAVSPEEDRAVCFLSSGRVCEITLGKLKCALSSKLLTTLTEGRVDAPETKTQLAKQMPSTSNIPTSCFEEYKSETSWNSDLEEDFFLPEDYFCESDESDS